MRMRHLLLMYKVILLIMIMSSACAVAEPEIPNQVTATNGLFLKATQTYPFGVTATQTTPLMQQTISRTPTKTHLPPMSTPQPTLDVSQQKELLQGLLQNNGDCRLPCIWGITQGNSDMDILNAILSPFNDISIPKDFYIAKGSREASGSATFILWKDNIRVPIRFSYYTNGTSIDYLTLNFQAGRETGEGMNLRIHAVYGDPFFFQTNAYYQLSNILVENGPPEEVFIAPFPDDPQYPPDAKIPFSIVLYYREQGFLLEYILPKETSGQYFVGCPAEASYLSIVSWNPEQAVPLKKVIDLISGVGINTLNIDYFQNIEIATNMTILDFYHTYSDINNTECVETLINRWP